MLRIVGQIHGLEELHEPDVPGAPVEAVIALSIVFVAAEIVHGLRGQEGLTAGSPWIVALVFGLLHGLGFAGALHEVGLPAHAILSLHAAVRIPGSDRDRLERIVATSLVRPLQPIA